MTVDRFERVVGKSSQNSSYQGTELMLICDNNNNNGGGDGVDK